MTRPDLACLLLAAFLLAPAAARAELPASIGIGVLNDMSGPYADLSGKGSVLAAQMAAEDFAAANPGAPAVRILSADHQNKADTGAAIARAWVDRDDVAAVVDVPNSAVALAVNQVMREKDRAFLASSSATSDLTGPQCSPTTVQWTFDTWALANGTARELTRQGARRWFFIGSDYALGASLIRDATAVIKANGGSVLGDLRAALGTTDLSSYLLQAQSSGADVIGTANAGSDAVNTVKQAAEFGIGRDGTQRMAGLLVFLTDVQAMGLQTAQGLLLTEAFYWDMNDETRAWSQRFFERVKKMPTSTQAGDYSSTMHYLKAVQAAGTTEANAVMAKMRDLPIRDFFAQNGKIRVDGRMVHDMYLMQVKAPPESKGPWDLYKLLATIPGDEAFRPLSDSACPLVKK